MPGDPPRAADSATKIKQLGRLSRACLTAKANPGALFIVLVILAFAAWGLWPLARFLLRW